MSSAAGVIGVVSGGLGGGYLCWRAKWTAVSASCRGRRVWLVIVLLGIRLVDIARSAKSDSAVRLWWLVGLVVVGSGCVLATPVYDVPVQNRCPYPVSLYIDSHSGLTGPTDPMRVEAREMPEHVHGSFVFSNVVSPGYTEDVDELLFEVNSTAGGPYGLEFVVALPVVQVSEEAYGFPDGPIVVEGDRCPPLPE